MYEAIWKRWTREDVPLRVGISGCLIGMDVRHDRAAASNTFLIDQLGPFVEWAPRCPEVEIGLGVPRSPLKLEERTDGEVRLMQEKSGVDFTEAMQDYARAECEALDQIDAFVLKKGSPTCGIGRVEILQVNGQSSPETGVGIFAKTLQQRWPDLPVEEEGRLNDPVLRANFVERLFGRNRWRALLAGPRSKAHLEEFHIAHKLLLRSHDESGYQALGQLLEKASGLSLDQLFHHYGRLYHETLRKAPAVGSHVNVMQYAMGYFRGMLDARDRRALRLALDDYQRGALPLVAPISLLRFHVEKHGLEDLAKQLYLEPHPKELLARRSA